MKSTIQHKWHLFTSVTLITTAIGLGTLSLSLASAKQRNQPDANRTGNYVAGSFTFSSPLQLTGHPPSNAFFAAAAEPEIKVDVFGNIYVTAIAGVPGGTD